MDADSGAASLPIAFLLFSHRRPPFPPPRPCSQHTPLHYKLATPWQSGKKGVGSLLMKWRGCHRLAASTGEGKDGPPHAPSLRATLPLCLVSPCDRAAWACVRAAVPAVSKQQQLTRRASPDRAEGRQGSGHRAGRPEAVAPPDSARSAEARLRAVLSTCQAACTTCLPAARRAPLCPPGASTASSRPGPRPAAGAGRHGSQPRSGGTVTGDSCFVEK